MTKPTPPVLEQAVAGQKNKASTYNSNFSKMKNYVDECMDYAVNVDLSNLSETGEEHFVNKTSAQTIAGNKTFTGDVNISGATTLSGDVTLPSSTISDITDKCSPNWDGVIAMSFPYTAPSNGFVCVRSSLKYGHNWTVNGVYLPGSADSDAEVSTYTTESFPVNNGDVIAVGGSSDRLEGRFIPMKG